MLPAFFLFVFREALPPFFVVAVDPGYGRGVPFWAFYFNG